MKKLIKLSIFFLFLANTSYAQIALKPGYPLKFNTPVGFNNSDYRLTGLIVGNFDNDLSKDVVVGNARLGALPGEIYNFKNGNTLSPEVQTPLNNSWYYMLTSFKPYLTDPPDILSMSQLFAAVGTYNLGFTGISYGSGSLVPSPFWNVTYSNLSFLNAPFSLTPVDYNSDGTDDFIIQTQMNFLLPLGSNFVHTIYDQFGFVVNNLPILTGPPTAIFQGTRFFNIADVDEDGSKDLIFLQAGNLHVVDFFTGVVKPGFPVPVSNYNVNNDYNILVGDFDADTLYEIGLVRSTLPSTIDIFSFNGVLETTYSFPTLSTPFNVTLADMNGDAFPEIVFLQLGCTSGCASVTSSSVHALSCIGGSSCANIPSYPINSIPVISAPAYSGFRLGDINSDSIPDILITKHYTSAVNNQKELHIYDGSTGTLLTQVLTGLPAEIDRFLVEDIDLDGKNELLFSSSPKNRGTSATGDFLWAYNYTGSSSVSGDNTFYNPNKITFFPHNSSNPPSASVYIDSAGIINFMVYDPDGLSDLTDVNINLNGGVNLLQAVIQNAIVIKSTPFSVNLALPNVPSVGYFGLTLQMTVTDANGNTAYDELFLP